MTAEFAKEALALHNKVRAHHNSLPLTWCPELQKKAKADATSMLVTGVGLGSRKSVQLGRNIFQIMDRRTEHGLDIPDDETALGRALDDWYKAIQYYEPNNPWGKGRSFSLMVWPKTTKVGVGIAKKQTQDFVNIILVAYYDPPGDLEAKDVKVETKVPAAAPAPKPQVQHVSAPTAAPRTPPVTGNEPRPFGQVRMEPAIPGPSKMMMQNREENLNVSRNQQTGGQNVVQGSKSITTTIQTVKSVQMKGIQQQNNQGIQQQQFQQLQQQQIRQGTQQQLNQPAQQQLQQQFEQQQQQIRQQQHNQGIQQQQFQQQQSRQGIQQLNQGTQQQQQQVRQGVQQQQLHQQQIIQQQQFGQGSDGKSLSLSAHRSQLNSGIVNKASPSTSPGGIVRPSFFNPEQSLGSPGSPTTVGFNNNPMNNMNNEVMTQRSSNTVALNKGREDEQQCSSASSSWSKRTAMTSTQSSHVSSAQLYQSNVTYQSLM